MTRNPVTTEDLIQSGSDARRALARVGDGLWLEKPPSMEWTRLTTVSHICRAMLFYATQLAGRSDTRVEYILPDETIMVGEKLPDLMMSQVRLLAAVAESAPPESRAWHPTGLPDPEGFLAMGCAEVMLHTWDTVGGTDVQLLGDEGVADRVLQRLFPWVPTDTPRWDTLLFSTGRGELPGYESPSDRWMWHNDVLEMWDGKEKRSDRWSSRA